MKRTAPEIERALEADATLLRLPATNKMRIDLDSISETLALYESDVHGFFDQIPRLR